METFGLPMLKSFNFTSNSELLVISSCVDCVSVYANIYDCEYDSLSPGHMFICVTICLCWLATLGGDVVFLTRGGGLYCFVRASDQRQHYL